MAYGKYQVKIPAGRWMAGVNRFFRVNEALAFMDRWNAVEVNSGNASLCWHRTANDA